jgi:hypothetical protein
MPNDAQTHPGAEAVPGLPSAPMERHATPVSFAAESAGGTISAGPRLVGVIEQVLATAERAASVQHSSVDLHFMFGAQDRLAVHLEWRDNTLHATFRATAPELRDSLAMAWREIAPDTLQGGRYRVAEPVITAEASSGLSTNANGGNHQRPSGGPAQPPLHPTAGRPATNTSRGAAAATEPNPAVSLPSPETAHRLHAFA